MRSVLLDLAAEPDIVMAMRIAEQLRGVAPDTTSSTVRLLVGAIGDPDPLVSIGAVHALAAVPMSAADDTLVDGLNDGRPWIREHAAWALAARRPDARAISGLIDLHGSGSDLTAMVAQRTLAGWAGSDSVEIGTPLIERLRTTDDSVVRRRLADTLGVIDTEAARSTLLALARDRDEAIEVRAAAIDAFSGTDHSEAQAALLSLANEASPIATSALLAMFTLTRSIPDATRSNGIRLGQLTLTGDLDGRLSQAGAGDTGGIAKLLVSVSHALARRDSVDSVLSIGRSSPDGELSSLLVPDLGNEGFSAISLGPIGMPPALASEWDHRLRVERGLRRALVRRPALDVIHLRMADVGTLAAAGVARRLGIRVVFTCAPDPHGPIALRQAAGQLTRENFGSSDVDEHLWFRARMVERLVMQSDHLVLFPRPGVRDTIERTMGVDREFLDRRSTVAPEGIELADIEAARCDTASAAVVEEIIARLPPRRHGRALVVSVGRLHPAKGMTRVVHDWLHDDRLTASTNLVIVGGDLDDPNPVERRILDEIASLLDGHPSAAGVVLLGSREPASVAQILAAAVRGADHRIARGGVYVNGAAKEEFGLAVLEALASGLPVVAPADGGPATYVVPSVTGLLVDGSDDLGPAMVDALELHRVPGREADARRMVEQRYTIDAYADSLAVAYDAVAVAANA